MTGWEETGLPGAADLDPVSAGQVEAGEGLLLDLGDVTFGLPVSHRLPGEESVTLTDDTGMTICADTDGDGRVDTLSVVTFDGGWSSWRRQDCMSDGVNDHAEDHAGDHAEDGSATAEIHVDVSSVTSAVDGDGQATAAEGVVGLSESAGEQGGRYGAWVGIPPATPGNGRGSWDARGWECVDRGNWG
ncbi:hypothetical protein [Corynebacterium kalidii]|jgi:hypothetical protein